MAEPYQNVWRIGPEKSTHLAGYFHCRINLQLCQGLHIKNAVVEFALCALIAMDTFALPKCFTLEICKALFMAGKSGLSRNCELPEARSDLLSLRAPVLKNVYALSYSGVDPIGVETVFGEEQFRIAMRNQPVGNAHAHQSYSVL